MAETIISRKQKSPGLAALSSLLICGIGQVYVGDIGRGIVFFIITVVIAIFTLGIGGLIMLIIVIIDAYNSDKLHNEGKDRKFLNF